MLGFEGVEWLETDGYCNWSYGKLLTIENLGDFELGIEMLGGPKLEISLMMSVNPIWVKLRNFRHKPGFITR